jgi:hypothetical protein
MFNLFCFSDVDLYQLQVNTLRRYKKHFKVPVRQGMNKMQLADVSLTLNVSFLCEWAFRHPFPLFVCVRWDYVLNFCFLIQYVLRCLTNEVSQHMSHTYQEGFTEIHNTSIMVYSSTCSQERRVDRVTFARTLTARSRFKLGHLILLRCHPTREQGSLTEGEGSV